MAMTSCDWSGGLMMVYAALYLAQLPLQQSLYDNPQPVWDVMNYVSGLGILVALIVNFGHMRSQSGSDDATLSRLGAHVLFYANAALAIWFFRNWIYLLALDEGEICQRARRRHLGFRRRDDPAGARHHGAQALANRDVALRRAPRLFDARLPRVIRFYECARCAPTPRTAEPNGDSARGVGEPPRA